MKKVSMIDSVIVHKFLKVLLKACYKLCRKGVVFINIRGR